MPDSIEYDAIVVGSGISGGWAAKELCEKGLKTLLLERGRPVEHISGYTTASNDPWDFPHGGMLTPGEKEKYHIQTRHYSIHEDNKNTKIKIANANNRICAFAANWVLLKCIYKI